MIKKIAVLLLASFILIALFYAVIQGPIGQNLIRKLIANSLKESGLEVQIDRVEGTLPNQINLKGVAIKGQGIDVTASSVSFRPVLWRLLKKELMLTNVFAKDIVPSFGAPFNFEGKFRVNERHMFLKGKIGDKNVALKLDRKTFKLRFKANEGDLFYAQGRALLNPGYQLISSDIQIESDELLSKLPFPASGKIDMSAHVNAIENGYQINATWDINQNTGSLKGEAQGVFVDRELKGEFLIEPFVKGTFDWHVQTGIGEALVDVENLQSLHLPNAYGKLHAKANWDRESVEVDATATDFYYGDYFAEKVEVKSDLKKIEVSVEKGKWKHLEVERANFKMDGQFELSAKGKWKHPLDIEMRGNKNEIEELTGTFYNHPLKLLKPLKLDFNQTSLELAVGDAIISGQVEPSSAHLKIERLPLDFFSLNALEVPISGTANLVVDVKEKNGALKGQFKGELQHMEPLDASGQFEGNLTHDVLTMTGHIAMQNQPLFDVNATIPIHLSIHPLSAKLEQHRPAKAQASWNTRVENFLDFFDLGTHRLEGVSFGEVKLSQTLYDPLVQGSLQMKDGYYENYLTGTKLHHIEASVVSENDRLILKSFTAQDDADTGTVTAQGDIRLTLGELYPFHVRASLNNLKFVEIDLVSATANGQIEIEGNTTEAVAKGEIQIIRSDFAIPDHIPSPPPDLQVIYRNPIHPVPAAQSDARPYPLFLDLHVTAPQSVNISGRGLDSQWTGDFHIGGTYTAIAAKGTLELINGHFNFSSRSFNLTEGSLFFSGVEHEMPELNIAGSTEIKGIGITARLHGPLNNPQITLQSSPALPLSSIMSYLLFGQDLAEISGFQALQIATSLASLAGTGPDVMESTRKALGLDRIRVLSATTEEGGETVALQVGKYVSEGVLVSFSQGADESSTNISVEIELKNNWVFEIQSDQRQEQGIFTLKWNLNY